MPPRNAESRAISQLVGVEGCGSSGCAVGSGLGSKLAQGVLRGVELAGPVFFIGQFVEKPPGNPILFRGRQGR